MNSKKVIFITGISGAMGRQCFNHLLKRRERLYLKLLVLPSKKEEKFINTYRNTPGIEVIWGDLTNPVAVDSWVKGADMVIHMAAVIPPLADYQPELAEKVNVHGTRSLVDALKRVPEAERAKFVYIGSVSQTGDRLPPYHWGRIGDPIKPSVYDFYAVTKAKAERYVIDSGLKYWVSLRQTAIAHLNLYKIRDGIIFHQPIDNCFEWITAHDAGLMIANLCDFDLPENFWGHIYNVGGGAGCRITNYNFLKKAYQALGYDDFKSIVDLNWFATRNFHGQWFCDSDKLQFYLKFRTQSLDDFFCELAKAVPVPLKLAGKLPPSLIRNFVMKPIALTKNGPLFWMRRGMENRIKAFFGSMDDYHKISDWQNFCYQEPSGTPQYLDHGYDEQKSIERIDLTDLSGAAHFRGGECLSKVYNPGEFDRKLYWKCDFDHRFSATPKLILEGGFWCPYCEPVPWEYDIIARSNPFLRQICHNSSQISGYDRDCYKDII